MGDEAVQLRAGRVLEDVGVRLEITGRCDRGQDLSGEQHP